MAVTVTAVFWAVRVQGAHGMSNHIWVHAWQRSYGAQHSAARRAYDNDLTADYFPEAVKRAHSGTPTFVAPL